MSDLVDLSYVSAASRRFDEGDLKALLVATRARNARRSLTGMLLYHEGSFLQVLEGPAATVDEAFERIARDPRHERVTVLRRRSIDERSFAEWHMAFVNAEALALEGFSDFLVSGRLPSGVSARGRLERILDGFRQGGWRQHIGSSTR